MMMHNTATGTAVAVRSLATISFSALLPAVC